MNIIIVIYLLIALVHGIHGVVRQSKRWTHSTLPKYALVFLINSIGWPITLFLSIVWGTFTASEGEPFSNIDEKESAVRKADRDVKN